MPDLLVVGGGLIGLASAWRAAQAGLEVVVVDPAPGTGASDVAAGMLAPVTEVAYGEEASLALGIAGARRWRAFAEELEAVAGVDVGYRPTGTLLVGFDNDDVAALRELHAFQVELGLDTTVLRSRELRTREPLLSPRVRGGVFASEDHRVEPRAVVAALLTACAAARVTIRRARVVRVDGDGHRVVGVTTADGEALRAGQVLLAAGAWSSGIHGVPDRARPSVRPVKGQVVHLRHPRGEQVLRTTVRGLVGHRRVYLVPRDDGRVVIGASQEERGFDVTVTAGIVRELLLDAATIVPGVDELELTEMVAGLRPSTADNVPVIGPGGVDGLLLATGHHRNGVLLTPITAEAVTAHLTGCSPDPVLAVAAPDRSAARGSASARAAASDGPQGRVDGAGGQR